jgi:hypothetical protein
MINIKAYELTKSFVENFNKILNMEFSKEEGIKVISLFSELQKAVNAKISTEISILEKHVPDGKAQFDDNGNPINILNIELYNKELSDYLQTDITINAEKINYNGIKNEYIVPSDILKSRVLFNI